MGKRSSLKLINDALALSAHVLSRDNSQLPAQLFGRLNNSAPDDVKHLMYQAEAAQRGSWLKPITSSLARPGGSLNRTLGDGGTEAVISVALTLDGLHATAGGAKGNLTVWNLMRGELILTIHAHNDAVNFISITPDGDRVVSASADGAIKVWELGTGLLLQSLSSPSPVKLAAMIGSGKYLVSGSQSRLLNVWDLNEARLVRELEDGAEIEAIAPMPDGRSVITAAGMSLKVWDATSGTTLRTIEISKPWLKAISPSSTGVYTDLGFRSLAVAPDASRIVCSASYDIGTAYDPNNIECGECGVVGVYDLEKEEWLLVLKGHGVMKTTQQFFSGIGVWEGGRINDVKITSDCKLAVSGADDATIKLWDLETGNSLRTFEGHVGGVNAVALSIDCGYVISASDDGTLKLWDLNADQSPSDGSWHAAKLNSVVVTSDNKHAISAYDDGAIVTARKTIYTKGTNKRSAGGSTNLLFSTISVFLCPWRFSISTLAVFLLSRRITHLPFPPPMTTR